MAKVSISKKLDMFLNEKFDEVKLEEVIGDRFGRYSKYIIQERAIPDIRDGLKPVQRRILYGMNALKVTSTAPYKKSARIVGEVMGKYHPHGDSSIYEALVRMSQNWKMEVPLIDMHGNNGSIDGDGPAAMRYTETRLSKNADYLLKDIDKNTVPFIPNFDEEEVEPTVLPGKFPNLLVNGAMGISSGYATYIPTHNLNEVINAIIARIDNPELTIDELLEIMPGPDFPTGGIIMGVDGIRESFLTGAGTVTVRSKYHIEDMQNGGKRIVITEIPYDTIKSKTVEKMTQYKIDGKVPDVLEVRDESGRDGLRIAIDLKKDANPDAIINFFFKNTDLQANINYNMVSICDRRPMRLGVLPIIDAYIAHQRDVITNRTNFELNKASKRLHIVEGLMRVIDITDEIIALIKASKDKADSIKNIVEKYGFSNEQAEAIVMMRLYRLSNQDITLLINESNELAKNIERYKRILNSQKELLKVIKDELKEMNDDLKCERKTEIRNESSQIKIDETDLIAKEQVVISISCDGYLKRASVKAYNAAKVNTLKQGDSTLYLKEVSTLDTLLIFTNLGNFIYLPVYKIPECKFKDVGAFISTIVSIAPKEKFVAAFALQTLDEPIQVLLASKEGAIKQVMLSQFQLSRYTKPVRAIKISDSDELVAVDMIKNPLEMLLFTHDADVLRFRASDVALYGTNAGGVKGINLKKNDYVVGAIYANKNDDFLLLTSKSTIKRMKVSDIVLTKRARMGQKAIKPVKSNPIYVIDAKKMTPNQYKENVPIYLAYENGNDQMESFTLKYNVSDSGVKVDTNIDNLSNLLRISLPKPTKADISPSSDYLDETTTGIFEYANDEENDKPISSGQAQNTSIFDELDAILAKEKEKTAPKALEGENKKDNNEKIKFTKISLFDDDDNQ